MIFLGYMLRLCAVASLIWVMGGYPVFLWGGKEVLVAAGYGFGISFVNALLGGWISLWAIDKSHSIFMQAVFGGMAIRMFIVLCLFFITIKLVELHVFGLTLSLFLFYVVFQFIEIRFFAGRPSGVAQMNKE